MSHPLDICPLWPPAGLGGCRICGGDWGPFRKRCSICEPCWTWAREFAAGRGRGPMPSRVEQLRKALLPLARGGRQLSPLGMQWVADRLRTPPHRVKVDRCGIVHHLRGVRLKLPDEVREGIGGAAFVVLAPNGEPSLVVRRPGSGGVAGSW